MSAFTKREAEERSKNKKQCRDIEKVRQKILIKAVQFLGYTTPSLEANIFTQFLCPFWVLLLNKKKVFSWPSALHAYH